MHHQPRQAYQGQNCFHNSSTLSNVFKMTNNVTACTCAYMVEVNSLVEKEKSEILKLMLYVHCTVPLFLTNSFIPDNRGCCAASTDLLTVNDNWIAVFCDLRWRKKRGNKPKAISSRSDGTAQATQSPTSKSDASLWTSSLWTRLHRFTNWFDEHYTPNSLWITPQTFLWTFGKRIYSSSKQ